MRQLLPTDAEVDPVEAYLAAHRPRPSGRPWLTVGMVASLDGATAVDDTSGALGGDADRDVFRAVRAVADVVLVAAGTVRAEGYGPVRRSAEVMQARARAGRRAEPARLAIVTSSLDLDVDAPFFTDGPPPIVFTVADADPERRARLAGVAELRNAGEGRVDLDEALRLLADDADVVVCEGGPSLNGALVDADLVDEWCLTIAPVVAGGDSRRLVHGASAATVPRPATLESLLVADHTLCGRWVRDR